MKKILLLAILAIAMTKVNAQWYYNLPPQVMNDPCVQASIAVANSTNRIMQYDMMIMQQQQIMMQNGWYYPQQNTGRYIETKEGCDNCSGNGYNYRYLYMGREGTRTIKQRCSFCHGTGMVRKSRYEIE